LLSFVSNLIKRGVVTRLPKQLLLTKDSQVSFSRNELGCYKQVSLAMKTISWLWPPFNYITTALLIKLISAATTIPIENKRRKRSITTKNSRFTGFFWWEILQKPYVCGKRCFVGQLSVVKHVVVTHIFVVNCGEKLSLVISVTVTIHWSQLSDYDDNFVDKPLWFMTFAFMRHILTLRLFR